MSSHSDDDEPREASESGEEAESRTGGQGPGEDGRDEPETERGREREKEDREFVPVIVKRTEQSRRHPDDILEMAIEEGVEQIEREALSLALSAVAAGLILGFTAMAVAVVSQATMELEEPLRRLATALVYPLGFVVCIMSGTELFTEHTATAVYPVLDRRAGPGPMLRLWAIVGLGNLVGTLGIAGLLALADPIVGAREGYGEVARHLVEYGTGPLLASAVLAGCLMALGAWLVTATPPGVGQLASIYIVVFLIGLGGLHHSIAGAAEAFTALFVGDAISPAEALRFVALAMVGNLLGGSLFVAGLNYAHIRQSRSKE